MNEAAHAIDPAAVAAAPRPTNVLVVGVGGQGVIMVSKVLARLAQRHDLEDATHGVFGLHTFPDARPHVFHDRQIGTT